MAWGCTVQTVQVYSIWLVARAVGSGSDPSPPAPRPGLWTEASLAGPSREKRSPLPSCYFSCCVTVVVVVIILSVTTTTAITIKSQSIVLSWLLKMWSVTNDKARKKYVKYREKKTFFAICKTLIIWEISRKLQSHRWKIRRKKRNFSHRQQPWLRQSRSRWVGRESL